jgi:site-specific DNA-adenine methylase
MSHFIYAYYGNKRSEIKNIINYFPPENTYNLVVEAFCGSSAVSFYLNKNSILNDLDKDLCDIYEYIKNNDIQNTFNDSYSLVNDLKNKGMTNREIIKNLKNDKSILSILALKFHERQLTYCKFFKNIRKPKKATKKQLNFQSFIKNKCVILNKNYLDIFESYKNNSNVFLFLDPPYLDSNNSYYYSESEIKENKHIINDNTKIFIDIVYLLKTAKCKIMMIINDNYLNRYLYDGFIKHTYDKQYSNTLNIDNKSYKRQTKHLIITNY